MDADAQILLVEDRQDDVLLLFRALEKAGVKNRIQVAVNGEQAVDYIRGRGKFSDRTLYPLPQLVLLDLKLPGMSGFDVLQWIRTDSQHPDLRVVVLTSSENVNDVNLAYRLGANSFLVKPTDFSRFVELANLIADTWFAWSKTPGIPTADQASDHNWSSKAKKVFLRARDSKKFYSGRSRWVAEKKDALDFERIELAEAVVMAERLEAVEIVLAYDRPNCELTLPTAFPGVRRT
jgi:CheY-like chemotaxis protein